MRSSLNLGRSEPDPLVGWHIFSELCQTDKDMLEDTHGRSEMDGLIVLLEDVDRLTDPTDPAYLAKRAAGDRGALADTRKQIITFEEIARRMVEHVSKNLNREILSGYDTIDINTSILKVFRLVLRSRRPSEDVERAANASGANSSMHGSEHEKKIESARTSKAIGTGANIGGAQQAGSGGQSAAMNLEAQTAAYVRKQNQLSDWGAATLIIDVLATSSNEQIVQAALEFGIQILDGGNIYVQMQLYTYLTKKLSDAFFGMCRHYIRNTMVMHETGDAAAATKGFATAEDDDDGILGIKQLFEFLRLWAEGHNLEMQDLLREQPNNRKNVNLLEDACSLLLTLTKDQVRCGAARAGRLAFGPPCYGSRLWWLWWWWFVSCHCIHPILTRATRSRPPPYVSSLQ